VKTEKKGKTPAQIFYTRRDEMELATEKLNFLSTTKLSDIKFEHIHPDKNNNWLNLTENNWDELLPIASKEGKAERSIKEPRTIFKLFSLGAVTARDEWTYDTEKINLKKKVRFFYDLFNNERERWSKSDKKKAINNFVDRTIKWTSELENHMTRGTVLKFDEKNIVNALYRPFVKTPFYYDRVFVHRTYQLPDIFPIGKSVENYVLCVNVGNKPFNTLVTDTIPDYHVNGDAQCFPLYRYAASESQTSEFSENSEVSRVENITDWALTQFQKHYKDKKITKEGIFHYVYAVLHHPAYRAKYEINLKREFPRIPFYEGFGQWADWGKRLMELHLNYESVELFKLERIESEKSKVEGQTSVTRLMARKDKGEIELDTFTTLRGVPAEAWEYRLGTYSALEWILERYKEKKPKDPTIAEKFNTYRFWDYREQVIDLLRRVCTVSVETMKIVREMPES